MTRQAAIDWARKRARRINAEVFVIWSAEETDPPGEHYQTATDEDLAGFYHGCGEPIAVVQPDGTIEA
jgi:hypothetical protein